MVITVCIGSSCHLKGSRQIIEQLQNMISERKLSDTIELKGAFCMGNCMNGVCVKIDKELFSVQPDNTTTFFENEVMKRL